MHENMRVTQLNWLHNSMVHTLIIYHFHVNFFCLLEVKLCKFIIDSFKIKWWPITDIAIRTFLTAVERYLEVQSSSRSLNVIYNVLIFNQFHIILKYIFLVYIITYICYCSRTFDVDITYYVTLANATLRCFSTAGESTVIYIMSL